VDIGSNVCIIGEIIIGNNVKIGAGSVVVNNIPDNCIVVGNPAKIIRTFTC
jgi:putative colanic acid biosynthesis acetyltransferase WcaB